MYGVFMLRKHLIPAVSAAAALMFLTSCAPDQSSAGVDDHPAAGSSDTDSSETEQDLASSASESAGVGDGTEEDTANSLEAAGPDISPEEALASEVAHLECSDDAALSKKAEHNDGSEPAGWPQEWDGTGAMPDPLCHPDYLEIGEWEDFDAHFACWEGIETSTIVGAGMSQEEIDESLWDQSKARADWEQTPAGGTCAEQWAANNGDDPEDYSYADNADDS